MSPLDQDWQGQNGSSHGRDLGLDAPLAINSLQHDKKITALADRYPTQHEVGLPVSTSPHNLQSDPSPVQGGLGQATMHDSLRSTDGVFTSQGHQIQHTPKIHGQAYGKHHFRKGRGGRGRNADQMTSLPLFNLKHARGIVAFLASIPQDATAWDIYSSFSRYGSVVFIDLDEASNTSQLRGAKLRFEPPPINLDFIINGRCQVLINKGSTLREHWTPITFGQPGKFDGMILTPNHKPCAPVKRLQPRSLTFGILTTHDTVLGKSTLHNLDGTNDLKLVVDFKRRIMKLDLTVETADSRITGLKSIYRLDIRFDRLSVSKLSQKKLYRTNIDGKKWAVAICLDDPPLVYKRRDNIQSAFWAELLQWTDKDAWFRTTDISPIPRNDEIDPSGIDVGAWRTLWIEMHEDAKLEWLEIERSLADWNIKTVTDTALKLVPGTFTKPALWNMLERPENHAAAAQPKSSWSADLALLTCSPAETIIRLPFEVRYQLEVCISRGVLCEYNITREFLEKLAELSSSKIKLYDSDRAKLVLEYAADQGKRIFDPMDLLQDPAAMTYFPPSWQIPEYCALIRKVTVTPTTMYFSTPIVETSNRVVRHYKHAEHFFLRVQFTDELPDGRIRGSAVASDNELYARCFNVLREGIRIGPWHWKFLAFGNSQIRENGVYFFCEANGGPTCDLMREWMGRFSHITVIAKYAARLGQCFSTTRLIRGIMSPRPVKIEDVELNGYCFTDGVGKISPFLASMVAQDWRLSDQPSAFQFRMGGCKGVLVAWNDVKGFEVHIRRSQEKFVAEFNGLEIIKCSQFANATLNRQTITILSTLGVPDSVFVHMMEVQLKGYNEALTNKIKAIELLQKYIDENQMTTTIAQMILDGFMDTNEPFVQTLLRLWRVWSVKALKEKARIVVDDGAFVLGCVDETGTLRGHDVSIEGQSRVSQDQLPQVFMQVPEKDSVGIDGKPRGFKVITGLCLVGRNPSLHPGDIRVVEAVDVPALRHIRNVLVFPMKGDRDVPSMLSGGDLDGDDFFVIWDQKLLPKQRRWGTPPMNYAAEKPSEEPSGVTADHLKSFFVHHMKYNQLGLIAHAHLATADYENQGADHPKCIELANLHSRAVDYVKTGIPAEFERKRLSPRAYPHFMEKSTRTYISTKALGQLYDIAKSHDFRFKASYETPFDRRILKRYKLGSDMLKRARQLKSQYDTAMRRIMGQMEIDTEFEVFSTFTLRKPRFNSDYKMQERLGHESFTLKQVFRDLCRKEVNGAGDLETLGPFVAAMYTVTSEEVRIALYEAHNPHLMPGGRIRRRRITPRFMPLISFPWLFDDILGKIARGADRRPTFAELGILVHEKPVKINGGIPKDMGDWENGEEIDGKPDYMRTAEGLIIHHGEVLHLFDHDSDDEYDTDDELIRSSEELSGIELFNGSNAPGQINGDYGVRSTAGGLSSDAEGLDGRNRDLAISREVDFTTTTNGHSQQREAAARRSESVGEAGEELIEYNDDELGMEEIEVKLDFEDRKETALDKLERMFGS